MRFIESILYQDGSYHNLGLHQLRLNKTFEQFLPDLPPHDLINILPKLNLEGKYKVRLVYDADEEDAHFDLEYAAYHPKKIESMQVMESDAFDYAFKYEDRTHINRLLQQSTADDIIISINGAITDGSYFNLVFWNGEEWLTPSTPLLQGVRRQQLLDAGIIREAPINVEQLKDFEKVSIINAMLGLEELVVPASKITF